MENKKQITIIGVSDIKIKETKNALILSSQLLKPYKTIFFSSKSLRLSNKEKKIIFYEKINKITSIQEYSNFLIYSLYKYIDTSHILIVQWDGYICNIKKWDMKYLNYDYVGAPFVPRDSDKNYSRDKKGNFYIIGNGGFSLRSKRLLEISSKFNLKDQENYTKGNEDGFFCVLHREFLEKEGLKWAPFSVAKNFSIETPLSFDDFINLPFGFHGRKMLYILFIRGILIKLKNILVFLKK